MAQMTQNDTDGMKQLLRSIDENLVQSPALTDKQVEDVKRLRAELRQHYQNGRIDEAKECEKMALQIIRDGAPEAE